MLDSAQGSYQRFFRPERLVRTIFLDLSAAFLDGRKAGGAGEERRKPESKKPDHEDRAFCLILMVPEIGVEPTTFALRMRCSTN